MKSVAILVAVLLGGISVKPIFFNTPSAEVDLLSITGARVAVSLLHQNAKNLPAQRVRDMSLVFPVDN